MTRNVQQGFSIIELLLVLILISVIGSTGYYVYNAQQKTDKTLDSTSQVVNHSSSAQSDTSNKAGGHTAPTNILVIKEWGVKVVMGTTDGTKLTYSLSQPSIAQADAGFTGSAIIELKDATNSCHDTGISVDRSSSQMEEPRLDQNVGNSWYGLEFNGDCLGVVNPAYTNTSALSSWKIEQQ